MHRSMSVTAVPVAVTEPGRKRLTSLTKCRPSVQLEMNENVRDDEGDDWEGSERGMREEDKRVGKKVHSEVRFEQLMPIE